MRPLRAIGEPTIANFNLAQYGRGNWKRAKFFSYLYDEASDVHGYRRVPHRHDFYELIWLTEGSGLLKCDMNVWKFEPGTLFFASPGRLHCWESETPCRGFALGFTDDFLQRGNAPDGVLSRHAYLYESEKPLLRLTGEARDEMTRLFDVLIRESADENPGREELARCYATIILTKARYWLETPEAQVARKSLQLSLVARFRRSVHDHFPDVTRVSDYARLLQTSRSQLSRKVQEETGQSASELIHERVLLEARRLLMYTSGTVAEIAYQLKFSDPAYFGRFFRKRMGQTPGEYRRQVLTVSPFSTDQSQR